MTKTKNIPTVFTIFGVTGDLAQKKIIPALFNLHQKEKLPKMMRIIGFSRRDLSQSEFYSYINKILQKHNGKIGKNTLQSFFTLFSYQKGNFENTKDYEDLSRILGRIDGEWKVCSNKLFYLAVPPSYYQAIFNHLAFSGLTIPCGPDEGWTRVLVEKPFGKDLETAEKLDDMLGKLFREEQIYRIDHYLAKEMLQNILNFRFSNNLFEQSWSNKLIEKIHIRVHEKIGVEERGVFYDGVGALRDVGQNHLLQMLALVTMEYPKDLFASSVREKRADILSYLKILPLNKIKKNTYRAQYKEYRQVEGVSKKSQTETYFKVKAELDHPKFMGIPIILESGKRIKDQVKEIIIYFKHPSPCLCPLGKHLRNKLIISLEPEEKIAIHFWSKKPGLENKIEERSLNFLYRYKKEQVQYVVEYEKLLLDCILGNQLLFLSTKEVKASWRFVDPIVRVWQKNEVPLEAYKPDTCEPVDNSFYIEKEEKSALKKEIGIVGLGKMGGNTAERLLEKDWQIAGYNRTRAVTKEFEKKGIKGAYSLEQLAAKLSKPRIILLSITSGKAVDEVLFWEKGLIHFLEKGDIVIDGGNSFYKDAIRREKKLAENGIGFMDLGISGGPSGARNGACLMVGGSKKHYQLLYPLFSDMAVDNGLEFFEGAGAGHFVKMVHNGIEYGIMQAIAEGFNILKKAKYKLDLRKVASVYNHGSVIESRLIEWLYSALKLEGSNLDDIKGSVDYTGEGEWTVKTAKEMKIKAKIIEEAFKFRVESQKQSKLPIKKQEYTGKILSALRGQFGGHKS